MMSNKIEKIAAIEDLLDDYQVMGSGRRAMQKWLWLANQKAAERTTASDNADLEFAGYLLRGKFLEKLGKVEQELLTIEQHMSELNYRLISVMEEEA